MKKHRTILLYLSLFVVLSSLGIAIWFSSPQAIRPGAQKNADVFDERHHLTESTREHQDSTDLADFRLRSEIQAFERDVEKHERELRELGSTLAKTKDALDRLEALDDQFNRGSISMNNYLRDRKELLEAMK